jgi:RNA polymerase sigma-70 factor (ECF subfamily)
MSDDASDVSAVRAGNPEAFARLYDRHAAVVLSLCRHCSSMTDAEDAMQETFLRAFRKLHQLNHAGGFRPWLYAIARRVCSERRRSSERRARHEAKVAATLDAATPPPISASDPVEHAEQLDRLTAAMGSLADHERLAIHLYYLDCDVPTAAETMGLSRGGFYKLLNRARDRLAVRMQETQPI